MKNYLKVLIILICIPLTFRAQGLKQTLQEIKAEKEAYFKKQEMQFGKAYLAEEGSEYNDYKRWLHLWEPRLSPNRTMEEYLNAVSNAAQYQSGSAKSLGNVDPWHELGPTNKPASGISDLYGGELGVGPIQYISFYRPNPNYMLACSYAGGLFYSSNYGLDWISAGSDNWPNSGCTSAAFSPTNSNTWYAASNLGGINTRRTSEANFAIGPGGIWRTTNAGANYTLIGDQSDFTVLGSNTTIHKILIDPNNAAVGYAATTGGLYKSTDINNTGTLPTWSSIRPGNIADIEFKSDNSNVIFITRQLTYSVTTGGYNISNDWVLEKSTNSGGAWTLISPPSGGFKANTSTTEPGNIEMAMTEADPNLIYLVDVKNFLPDANIYTYNYTTGVWTTKRTLTDLSFGMGRTFGVSNFDANIVYFGRGMKFHKSTNGGVTDVLISSLSSATKYHLDVEYIVCPPTTISSTCPSCSTDVWVATHGGISYSHDACSTLSSRSSGLGVAELWGMSEADQDPERIAMGLNHDGTVVSTNDIGTYSNTWEPTWETRRGGDGMQPLIDYSNSNNLWAAYLGSTTYSGQYALSTDYGSTYSATVFPWIANCNTIKQNQKFPGIVYANANPGTNTLVTELYRADNNGTTNSEKISDFISQYTSSNVYGIYPSPSDPNVMYVSVYTGNYAYLYKNTQMLASASTVINSWVQVNYPSPNLGFTNLVVDYGDPNIVYMTRNDMWGDFNPTNPVYKINCTNPATPTTTALSGGLPLFSAVTQIVLEKGSNGGMYIATGLGQVYYRNNVITTWTQFASLPHVPPTGLEINYVANKIRIGYHGRGVWEHDLYCPSTQSYNFTAAQTSTNFYEAVDEIHSTSTVSASATVTYRAGTEITLNPGFTATPNSSNYFSAYIHPCSYPGNSYFTKKLDGTDVNNENNTVTTALENITPTADYLYAYPNPNEGEFTVALGKSKSHDIFIYDLMGRIVYSIINYKEQNLKVDLSGFSAGVYIIKSTGENKVYSQRIVKR